MYASMKAAILAHSLQPGTKLPEDELAEVYAVSRTVVRSALQALATTGWCSWAQPGRVSRDAGGRGSGGGRGRGWPQRSPARGASWAARRAQGAMGLSAAVRGVGAAGACIGCGSAVFAIGADHFTVLEASGYVL